MIVPGLILAGALHVAVFFLVPGQSIAPPPDPEAPLVEVSLAAPEPAPAEPTPAPEPAPEPAPSAAPQAPPDAAVTPPPQLAKAEPAPEPPPDAAPAEPPQAEAQRDPPPSPPDAAPLPAEPAPPPVLQAPSQTPEVLSADLPFPPPRPAAAPPIRRLPAHREAVSRPLTVRPPPTAVHPDADPAPAAAIVQREPSAQPKVAAATTPAAANAAEASFGAQLLASIQAAAQRNYPASARMMGVTGQAVVSFEYRDGSVYVKGLAQSSGSPVLDHAALTAVQTAAYPPPPPTLSGHTLAKLVHVKFTLDSG